MPGAVMSELGHVDGPLGASDVALSRDGHSGTPIQK